MDSIFEQLDIKVEQQADWIPGELEIREHLSFVDRSDRLDHLELNDNLVLDQQIQPIPLLQVYRFIDDGKRLLTFDA
jgi:hypothetical protein